MGVGVTLRWLGEHFMRGRLAIACFLVMPALENPNGGQ
jgi:hypothetical protein